MDQNNRSSYYNTLSLISAFALVLLIILQVLWLKKAIHLHQIQNQEKLSRLVGDLALDINSVGHDYFHGESPKIDELPNDSIENVIDRFIVKENISNQLSFAIFQDSVGGIFRSNAIQSDSLALRNSPIKACLSCIVSFGIVKNAERKLDETDEAFAERLSVQSEFQYYSPVTNIEKDETTLWFALHDTHSLSSALRSMLYLFGINLLLLCMLLGMLYYLLTSLSKYKLATQAKDDFFNNMTHEFKTPLSSIRLASRVLRDNQDPAKKDSYHSLIEKESKNLESQIDKLLQLSLLDGDEIALEKEEVNLEELLNRLPDRIKPLFEEKRGTLNIFIEPGVYNIIGDEHHLSNAFLNMIENSLKYAKQEVQVDISLNQEENDAIVIRVKDNGPGIDKAFQDRIFDRFYRAKKDNAYQGPGFGIGLSYVKSIIEAHKGSIKLNTTHPKGCEFIIQLP